MGGSTWQMVPGRPYPCGLVQDEREQEKSRPLSKANDCFPFFHQHHHESKFGFNIDWGFFCIDFRFWARYDRFRLCPVTQIHAAAAWQQRYTCPRKEKVPESFFPIHERRAVGFGSLGTGSSSLPRSKHVDEGWLINLPTGRGFP